MGRPSSNLFFFGDVLALGELLLHSSLCLKQTAPVLVERADLNYRMLVHRGLDEFSVPNVHPGVRDLVFIPKEEHIPRAKIRYRHRSRPLHAARTSASRGM